VLNWRNITLAGVLLLTLSCFREEVVMEAGGEVFELTISPATHEFIHSSRDTSYSIDDEGVLFTLNGDPVNLKDIRTRGKTALRYQRKSYSVFLSDPLTITGRSGGKDKVMSRFKLLAMAADYTYIENRIGLGLLEQVGVNELFYKFVELRINAATEGVYMLVEDPEQFFKEQGSEYILRRYYHHWIGDSEYEPSFYYKPELAYENRFKEIYQLILNYDGEALYLQLKERFHIEHYFRKMGVDYLLKNGDYSDEIFFYAMVRDDEIKFDIIPWDYDDLFSEDPHEVGVTWGIGNLFGERYYATYEEVLAVLGEKLIFSIEDDLDYIIATDPYLYARYEEQLRVLIGIIENQGFESLFGQIRHELAPYYHRDEVVQQSESDQDLTSPELWESNMIEKQAFLESRLAAMKNQLNSTQ